MFSPLLPLLKCVSSDDLSEDWVNNTLEFAMGAATISEVLLYATQQFSALSDEELSSGDEEDEEDEFDDEIFCKEEKVISLTIFFSHFSFSSLRCAGSQAEKVCAGATYRYEQVHHSQRIRAGRSAGYHTAVQRHT